jgi:hypothetical protein
MPKVVSKRKLCEHVIAAKIAMESAFASTSYCIKCGGKG